MDEFNYAIRLLLRARRKRLTQEKSWKIRNTRHLEKCQIWVETVDSSERCVGRKDYQSNLDEGVAFYLCLIAQMCKWRNICRINLVPIRVLTQAIWSRILFSLMSYFVWALSDVCTVELYRMSRMSQRAQRAADKSKVKKRNTNKQISDLARILRAVCQRAE
jgi:hypothetical protein